MSFTFKKFSIDDTHCAMKVGTDGVLLGAWARIGDARQVLDVGTGSGLVAVMLAQRFPQATITGLDIDEAAVMQASGNMQLSPWGARLRAEQKDFLEWNEEVDAIVCNPPFFARALKCPDSSRAMARHDDTLPLSRLASHASALLKEGGVLAVILPADVDFVPPAMCLRRRCMVHTVAQRPPKRQLLEFVKGNEGSIKEEELVLTEAGMRTAGHQSLTCDFYLR